MQGALDANLDRVASSKDVDMISITVFSDTEAKRLTVDPTRPVHEAIAMCSVCCFGDTDVLEGESFEDHGVEVGVTL